MPITQTPTETETPQILCPVTGEPLDSDRGYLGPNGILVHSTIDETHVWSDYHNQWLDREDAIYCGYNDDHFFADEVVCLQPDNEPVFRDSSIVAYPSDEPDTAWDRRQLERFSGRYYTPDWIERNTFVCVCCGDCYHDDDYGSDGECEGCSTPESASTIRDYSCREAATYPSETKDALRFGIEMETEVRESVVSESDAAEAVADSFPPRYAILKEDGSLDNGFEIVTRPDSLKVHRRILTEAMRKFPSGLRAWKTGRCGMHIHVSRKPLSGLQQGKILVFVNHPGNSDFIVKIAGRDSNQWAKRYQKKHQDARVTYSGDRYEAVNLTPHTLEFRIFRGTICRDTAIKNLEFVAALVSFCTPAATSINEAASHQAFCNFVRKHRKEYPTLDAWLVDHKFLPALPQKPGQV